MTTINVPIGAAKVEYGNSSPTIFDITKGGIVFSTSTASQDVTVDQWGDTPVKSILKGRKASVVVPFALHDLAKLAEVIPNSQLVTDAVDATKKKLIVKSNVGADMFANAEKLVIKPSDPAATANDWITIPLAAALADPEYTYTADNERVVKITFTALVDTVTGELYTLGDTTATA